MLLLLSWQCVWWPRCAMWLLCIHEVWLHSCAVDRAGIMHSAVQGLFCMRSQLLTKSICSLCTLL